MRGEVRPGCGTKENGEDPQILTGSTWRFMGSYKWGYK